MDKVGRHTLEVMRLASWYNDWLFSFVKPYLGKEVLEIGAGIGNFTGLLLQDASLWAIDINEEYVNKLNKEFGREAKVGYGDVEKGKYFFKKKKFDTVICMNVLEHIKNDDKALKNMYSLLKMGGTLLLLVPANQFAFGGLDENLGHIRRYSKKEIMEKLEDVGYRIRTIRFLNFFGIWGWFLNSKLIKKSLLPENQLRLFDKLCPPFLNLEKFIEPPLGLSIFIVAEK